MAKILSLKTWQKVEYRVGEGDDPPTISFKVKRLRFHEASEFTMASADAWAALGSISQTSSMDAQAEGLRRFYKALPSVLIEKAFEQWVKDVQGLEIDEAPATEGKALYDVADEKLVLFVMTQLRVNSRLSNDEGKGSALLSTSSAAPQTAAGDSAATSTAPGGGRTH